MDKRTIFITEHDKYRLKELLVRRSMSGGADGTRLGELARELDRANVVAPRDNPKDVITMNSRFRLTDLDLQESFDYTLVFPEDANPDQDKVSVLAPIGTAVLGTRVGDVVEWPTPSGVRRLRLDEILFQPESSGNYVL